MKTFAEFQEAALAIPAAAGVISKVLPAAAATIGGIGTIMQARKKRKIGSMEKRLYDRQKTNTDQSDDLIKSKPGEVEKQNKLIDKYIEKQKSRKPFDPVKSEPTIKPPTLTGRVDKTKGAPTPKRTTFKKANQFEDVVPTNNASGDAIAGLPPDNPPVKRKKRYIYGGTGSRKMWMANK